MSASSAAFQAVKNFRLHEFNSLKKHILKFGPISPSQNAEAAAIRLPNPFVPRKNPKTGRWVEAKYSLRRQAELVKKAKAAGLLHLLPTGPKNPPFSVPSSIQTNVSQLSAEDSATSSQRSVDKEAEEGSTLQEVWALPIDWEGSPEPKPVPGAISGTRLYAGKKRMFKGHKWERVQKKREARKRILLRDMDRRVYNYKNYYKRRRPHPLKPPRTSKAPKIPF
ncbi:hypothetical protein AMATHDRAFT_60720 [Amanita thiersii Skay4041]|uniref:Large ribosomal subunit protein mL59 domain-containing protein n=1 Tax=Amanita thiersii Skay4041 TaxID=703135 RepID=A0A2A9NS75_9AGAR|nr:hypothetical protein AMATHDRAFT_60720 [Amanita thiersii Skay4041]